MTWQMLDSDRGRGTPVRVFDPDASGTTRRRHIRCPVCAWTPSKDSRWCCGGSDFAAPDFDGCGRVWNTFDTGGECPGCHHVWEWTACLWCHEWSRHADWYVDEDEPT